MGLYPKDSFKINLKGGFIRTPFRNLATVEESGSVSVIGLNRSEFTIRSGSAVLAAQGILNKVSWVEIRI